MQTLHDGLAIELGIEEKTFTNDEIIDIEKQLLIVECREFNVLVTGWWRILVLLLVVEILIGERFCYLCSQRLVFEAEHMLLSDDDDGIDDDSKE